MAVAAIAVGERDPDWRVLEGVAEQAVTGRGSFQEDGDSSLVRGTGGGGGFHRGAWRRQGARCECDTVLIQRALVVGSPYLPLHST